MPAFIGFPYSQQMTATGGTAPYKFFIKSGSLPSGLTMSTGGLISGTPTLLGTFNFVMQAIDGFNGYGERAYAFTINTGVLTGFNTYLTTVVAPNRTGDWKFDEASGTIANFGTATLASLNAVDVIQNTYQQPGDVSYETDFSIACSGAGNSGPQRTAGLNPASFPNSAIGHIGMVIKTNVSAGNGYTDGDMMFAKGSASTTAFTFVRGVGTGAATRLEWRAFNTGTGYEAHTRCENVGGLDDDQYHLLVIIQDGLGGGPRFNIDGVDYDTVRAGSFTNYAGGGTPDDWFDDGPTQGRISFMQAAATGNNPFPGAISRAWISTDIPTSAQLANLQQARFGQIPV